MNHRYLYSVAIVQVEGRRIDTRYTPFSTPFPEAVPVRTAILYVLDARQNALVLDRLRRRRLEGKDGDDNKPTAIKTRYLHSAIFSNDSILR